MAYARLCYLVEMASISEKEELDCLWQGDGQYHRCTIL
jgi:hypothetical protein